MGKLDIFSLTPRGLVLPRDFTLGLAAILASTLSNQRLGRIWRLAVYAKSACENIPNELLNELRKVADHAEID